MTPRFSKLRRKGSSSITVNGAFQPAAHHTQQDITLLVMHGAAEKRTIIKITLTNSNSVCTPYPARYHIIGNT